MTTCKVVKKSAMRGAAPKAAGVGAEPENFQILDTENSKLTYQGVDVHGHAVDISAVATLTVSSSDEALATVDTPVGMEVTAKFLAPGQVSIIAVATWNDGSRGPFTITTPVTISGSAAVGLTVTFGTPTVR